MHHGFWMRFLAPRATEVTPLSTIDERWQTRRNVWGDRPEIDFAYCRPWQLLGRRDIRRVADLVETHRHRAWHGARSLSLRGVEPLLALFGQPRLARLCSRIAGAPLRAHPMRLEHCHVNLQATSARPVDDWHQDYVPFVLVIVIAKSGGPPSGTAGSGRLVTPREAFSLEPGDAILMQGSHVSHMAEPVVGGDRITAVLSLAPASPTHVDGTRVFGDRPPYDPSEPLAEQFLAYRRGNLERLAHRVARCRDDDARAALIRRMAFEQARIDEARGTVVRRDASEDSQDA